MRPKPKKESGWQIIAGERRWRAAQKAGLHEIPVLIHEIEDSEVAIIALLENIQREDLSPLEEAGAFKKLIEDFGLTQEKLSKALGCSRVYITNMLRLLTLPKKIKSMLDDKLLNVGQVRALIGKKNIIEIANTIVNKQLNVRQVEDLIRSKHLKHKTKIYKDPNIIDLEKELEDFLGLKIEIKDKKGKGEIIFKYENLDQLDEIIRKVKMNSS